MLSLFYSLEDFCKISRIYHLNFVIIHSWNHIVFEVHLWENSKIDIQLIRFSCVIFVPAFFWEFVHLTKFFKYISIQLFRIVISMYLYVCCFACFSFIPLLFWPYSSTLSNCSPLLRLWTGCMLFRIHQLCIPRPVPSLVLPVELRILSSLDSYMTFLTVFAFYLLLLSNPFFTMPLEW